MLELGVVTGDEPWAHKGAGTDDGSCNACLAYTDSKCSEGFGSKALYDSWRKAYAEDPKNKAEAAANNDERLMVYQDFCIKWNSSFPSMSQVCKDGVSTKFLHKTAGCADLTVHSQNRTTFHQCDEVDRFDGASVPLYVRCGPPVAKELAKLVAEEAKAAKKAAADAGESGTGTTGAGTTGTTGSDAGTTGGTGEGAAGATGAGAGTTGATGTGAGTTDATASKKDEANASKEDTKASSAVSMDAYMVAAVIAVSSTMI